ncbi:hypothetical protein PMAYCL1PPCAC_20239 [Pristionchus mayeri]|uniref:Uncharacterized protein n=1 Tax=Pristionchus mayeri TaxID=1317129 RepID=A0AAN5CSZ8_9BILA|nr:hypothetical protein PMAYCL1PPCAC_20239 [Pristionchus mayeri]
MASILINVWSMYAYNANKPVLERRILLNLVPFFYHLFHLYIPRFLHSLDPPIPEAPLAIDKAIRQTLFRIAALIMIMICIATYSVLAPFQPTTPLFRNIVILCYVLIAAQLDSIRVFLHPFHPKLALGSFAGAIYVTITRVYFKNKHSSEVVKLMLDISLIAIGLLVLFAAQFTFVIMSESEKKDRINSRKQQQIESSTKNNQDKCLNGDDALHEEGAKESIHMRRRVEKVKNKGTKCCRHKSRYTARPVAASKGAAVAADDADAATQTANDETVHATVTADAAVQTEHATILCCATLATATFTNTATQTEIATAPASGNNSSDDEWDTIKQQ